MGNEKFGLPELQAYLREQLKLSCDEAFPAIVTRQISKYVLNDGFSYKEIGRCVYYYLKVKNGTYNDLYGIWFVGKFRDQAARYWAKKESQEAERRRDAKKFETKGDTVVFNVQQILRSRKKPYRLEPLRFDDVEEGGSDDGHK